MKVYYVDALRRKYWFCLKLPTGGGILEVKIELQCEGGDEEDWVAWVSCRKNGEERL